MAPVKIGIVMDPIATIKPHKDSTVAMMKAAARRGDDLYYMGVDDLFVEGASVNGLASRIVLTPDGPDWCRVEAPEVTKLNDFKQVWMRKDPPVDKRFLHACFMLEHAVRTGATVLNDPTSLIALNEKLFAGHFPDLCPPTVVTSNLEVLRNFMSTYHKIIIKPLDAMGGSGVFMVTQDDVNFEVVWEMHTGMGTYPVMAQSFLPEIKDGDKRIIMIAGEAFPHVLVRTPKQGSIRGNMAAGGSTHVREINAAENKICAAVGPELVRRGVVFAGLDVIGDKLIEINITSPTGLVQIGKESGIDVADVLVSRMLE